MTNEECEKLKDDLDTLIEIFDEFNQWLDEREEKMLEQKRLLEEYEKTNHYER